MRVAADGADTLLDVLVVPGASRASVVGPHGDALRVRVAAPPERGRANDAVTELLAAALGIRPADVRVERGHAARRKTLRIAGLAPETVRARIAAATGPR